MSSKKKWYRSKSIWLAAMAVGVAVVESLTASPDWKTAALAGFGAAGAFIRALTDEGITF
jgi:hypothetical protein